MASRQVQPYRRPLPRLACDPHLAAGLLREAGNLRQPEAGAVARLLGGEERLARPRRDLGRHAGPGIGHGDHHVLLIEHGARRLYGEQTCLRHRITCIDRQIEQRGFELAGIGGQHPDPMVEHGLDADPVVERMAQQLRHLRHQLVGIERPHLGGPAPANASRLPGERRCAVAAVADHLQVAVRLGLRLLQLQDLEGVADHVQQIVEIVCHFTGKQAEGFHLLRVCPSGRLFRAAGAWDHDGRARAATCRARSRSTETPISTVPMRQAAPPAASAAAPAATWNWRPSASHSPAPSSANEAGSTNIIPTYNPSPGLRVPVLIVIDSSRHEPEIARRRDRIALG